MPPDQAIGKDLYLVPFKPQDPTPEFIELLDDVHLPEIRTETMLLGVFVLQKGRLSNVPPVTTAPAPAPLAKTQAPPTAPAAVNQSPALPITSLDTLLPGGLTEQHKTLLQSLMTSQAVTSSLAQNQTAALLPQTTSLGHHPGFAQSFPSSNALVSPPQPYPGSSTSYPNAPHIPPSTPYGGYLPTPSDTHPYSTAGPSGSYVQPGPPVHPSRHMK